MCRAAHEIKYTSAGRATQILCRIVIVNERAYLFPHQYGPRCCESVHDVLIVSCSEAQLGRSSVCFSNRCNGEL